MYTYWVCNTLLWMEAIASSNFPGTFLQNGITIIPVWISKNIHNKLLVKLFIDSQTAMAAAIEVLEWMSDFLW